MKTQERKNARTLASTTTLTMVLGVMVLAACTKESVAPSAPTSESSVTPRVKRFVAAATSAAHTKDNGFFTADSAIWYIEAGLNFTAAQAWRDFTELSADSIIVDLDVSSGTVAEGAVYAVYNELAAQLAAVNTSEQHLEVVGLNWTGFRQV